MSGAEEDYDYGIKRNWRRWQWNQIARRCGRVAQYVDDNDRRVMPTPRVRDAVVLYLAGRENLDLPVAMAKGFRRANMIAVERDERVIAELRAQQCAVIRGDIMDAAVSYAAHSRVDVLIADLCGGASIDFVNRLTEFMRLPSTKGAVISLNMLRGRDAGWNGMRMDFASQPSARTDLSKKHRAVQSFAAALLTQYWDWLDAKPDRDAAWRWLWELCDPSPNHYYNRRKRNAFDSVVFTNPAWVLRLPEEDARMVRAAIPELLASVPRRTRLSVAANKAIRTRRQL